MELYKGEGENFIGRGRVKVAKGLGRGKISNLAVIQQTEATF